FVRLAVYDLLGRRVRQLVDCRLKAGFHAFIWDGRAENGLPCASGTYLIRAESTAGKAVQKATLLK
ncbi:MAG: hypothetical protein ONB12_14065, partial [candidate division KSB1 bacterium]|nr:hypothetical protein [candidate division KSB1 bacterium]